MLEDDLASRAKRNLKKEVAGRLSAEADLQRARDGPGQRVADRTAELSGIIEGTLSPIFSLDREYRYVAFNRSHASTMRALYGAEIEVGRSMLDYMTVAEDREKARTNLDRALAGEHLLESAFSGEEPGPRRYFEVSHHPVRASDGQVIGVAVFANDVSERQRAEEDRLAHLRFFERLDQVNRALHGTNDLEQMMRDVLDAALDVFDCDRAWLVNPCGPESASYRVSMERTRPEFPGALARGLELPVDPEIAGVLRAVRASDDPVTFGPGSELALPTQLAEHFGVQSQIAVAVHPKVSEPYVFGLHQCSRPRIWTPEDAKLLRETGRRLGDALTSLLTYRGLRESEERYRTLIQRIQAAVVVHGPDARVLASNSKAQELLGLSEDQLLGRTVTDRVWQFSRADGTAIPPEEYPACQVCSTRQALKDRVARIHRPGEETADDVWVLVNADPVLGRDGEVLQVIVTFTDITELKRLETEQTQASRALRLLSDANQALIRITDEATLLNEVCRIAVDAGGYRLAWVGVAGTGDAKSLRLVAQAGPGSGDLEPDGDIRADEERGRGPGGDAVRTGRSCIVRSMSEGPGFDSWRDAAGRRGYRSAVALPLASEGRTFGALVVYAGEEGAFDAREVEVLEEMAGNLAFGVTALRTREERHRAERALAVQHATLRGIVEGTTSPIYSLDRECRYVAFNRSHVAAMKSLYGADIEVGCAMLDYVTVARDRDRARKNFDRALAGEHLLDSFLSGDELRSRRYYEVSHHPVRASDGRVSGVAVFANDVTERRRAEGRLRKEAERGSLLLDVFLRSPQLSEKQIYDDVLELAVRLTDSTIGFLHRVSEDQKSVNLTTWSKVALESCSAVHETHYPIDTAGNWVDCVRLGRPVIYNDFASSPNQKGLPPGHAPVRRFLSVPVVEGDKVRVIFGVGNKAGDYDDDDVFQVQQIANELQKVITQRRTWGRAELLGRLYRTISEMNQVIVREKSRDRLFAEVCRIGVEHGEFAMAWAGLADRSGGTVRPVAAAGVEAAYADELIVRLDAPTAELRPAARAVVEDRAVIVDDTETDPAFAPWRTAAEQRGFRSCAAFPVHADGNATGVLAVYAGRPGVFRDEVATLLGELAADLGFALRAIEAEDRRGRAEQELRAERGLFVGGATVVFAWKAEAGWPVEYVSPNVRERFGYSPEDFTTGKVPFAGIVHPDDLSRVTAEVAAFSAQGVASFEQEYRIACADGRYRWIQDFTTVHRRLDGAVAYYHGYLLDVTERIQAEREVVRVNRALRMLSDTNQALIRATDEPTLLTEVCRIAVDVGGYLMAWVGFAEHDEARTVRPVARAGLGSEHVDSTRVTWANDERGRGPAGTSIRTGRPCIVRGVPADPDLAPWREEARRHGYRSVAALPLLSEGQAFGTLGIYAGEEGAFDSREVEILTELAGDLAFGITALRTRAKRDRVEAALEQQHATLRESEERYRLIAENTADTITVLDLNLRHTYVSPSILKLRGYSVAEAMAQPLEQAFTPASLQEIRKLFVEQMALEERGDADPSRAVSLELEEYCKDGSTIWVEIAVSFLRDAALKPTGILAVTRDITRRKKADLQLVASEQKYRSLADSSPDNIVRYDADARRVYVNRNMAVSVGLDLGSRLGLTPAEGAPYPGAGDYEETLRRVIRSGEPGEVEVTVPNPAGEMRIHSIRFVAERSSDGRIIGALAFGRDVTEQKEAARERQRYLVRLRQDLEDAVAAIAATVEARDPYTAGHQRRVAALAAAIARELGLAEEDVRGIHLAGTIHDLGKIKVPAEILARPGQLSDIEARLIQIHPEAGWEILKGVEFPWPIAEMVLEHHERLDGSGYPKGLAGEQISRGARIIAVADVVEAMASHRPYRASRGLSTALSQIEGDRETLFDAAVVDACLRLFREKGYRLAD